MAGRCSCRTGLFICKSKPNASMTSYCPVVVDLVGSFRDLPPVGQSHVPRQ
jgi:hypothetical protein